MYATTIKATKKGFSGMLTFWMLQANKRYFLSGERTNLAGLYWFWNRVSQWNIVNCQKETIWFLQKCDCWGCLLSRDPQHSLCWSRPIDPEISIHDLEKKKTERMNFLILSLNYFLLLTWYPRTVEPWSLKFVSENVVKFKSGPFDSRTLVRGGEQNHGGYY